MKTLRVVSKEEIESLHLSRLIDNCVAALYLAAKADRKDNEDLFADEVLAIGRDKQGSFMS